MKKKITYQIKIAFEKSRPECGVGKFLSPYIGSKGYEDSITFSKSMLRIDLKRSKLYTKEEILSNNRNSVYEQVQKSLLAYYAIATSFPQIKRCTLIIYKRENIIIDFTNNISQPVRACFGRKLSLSSANSVRILQNDTKGLALRSVISYWLSGMCSDDIYQRFDKLWRAYDRILLYQGNTDKEREGINCIKTFIRTNSDKFIHSVSYTKHFPIDLNTMSWGKLLLDKPSDISRKITQYSDSRILDIFRKVCNDHKIASILTTQSKLQQVQNHFVLNSSTTDDIELVLLLSLTYTYYIRCKMFHAEYPDSSFKLIPTYEDKIIEALSELLGFVINEIIEIQTLLR